MRLGTAGGRKEEKLMNRGVRKTQYRWGRVKDKTQCGGAGKDESQTEEVTLGKKSFENRHHRRRSRCGSKGLFKRQDNCAKLYQNADREECGKVRWLAQLE